MRRPITILIAPLTLLVTVLAAPLGPASAQEATDGEPVEQAIGEQALATAVVALGDSYISGEGGRWEGNHASDYGDRRGTDRAAYRNGWGWWRYDQGRVYGPTASGCHRSDVSPVATSGIAVDLLVNLACSGASTRHLIRAEQGGSGHRGEPSQADQLASIAPQLDIEMIVVSIGGNDLGFGNIILDCALGYTLSSSWWSRTCHQAQQRRTDERMPDAMASVGRVLDEIRAVMADAGQQPGDYRLVLQSYPSPVPSGDDFRYSQGSWGRTFIGGCPFWNVDATWARETYVPRLAGELAAVAESRGAELLDLQDALDGREICAEGVTQGDGDNAEWARYLSTGILQGELQESIHPNAFGQKAIGTCLGLLYQSSPGAYHCAPTPGSGPEAMTLTPA